jgi:hypothetical protein
MAHLSAESTQRIADARRDAETELRKALSGVSGSDDVAPYLSAFRSFACAQFDAEAGELLTVYEDADGFRMSIEDEVAPRIIEGILPDRGLNRVAEDRTDEVKRLSIRHDSDTDLLWQLGPHGNWKPAGADVIGNYAQVGDWENFVPQGDRFLLRFGSNKATVRAVLCQTLQQRVEYWVGRFPMWATAGSAEPNGDESTRADSGPTINAADTGGTNRRAAVDAFLLRFRQETAFRAHRNHIWRAVGHTRARQFEFWQGCDPKATAQDDQNFRRILGMNPSDFESLLKKKRII